MKKIILLILAFNLVACSDDSTGGKKSTGLNHDHNQDVVVREMDKNLSEPTQEQRLAISEMMMGAVVYFQATDLLAGVNTGETLLDESQQLANELQGMGCVAELNKQPEFRDPSQVVTTRKVTGNNCSVNEVETFDHQLNSTSESKFSVIDQMVGQMRSGSVVERYTGLQGYNLQTHASYEFDSEKKNKLEVFTTKLNFKSQIKIQSSSVGQVIVRNFANYQGKASVDTDTGSQEQVNKDATDIYVTALGKTFKISNITVEKDNGIQSEKYLLNNREISKEVYCQLPMVSCASGGGEGGSEEIIEEPSMLSRLSGQ